MATAGFPHLAVTPAEVRQQSGMDAPCTGCHRGDDAATEATAAHKGVGRLLVVRKKGLLADSPERALPLAFLPGPLMRMALQKLSDGKAVNDTSVQTILFHDRQRQTLSQDWETMEATCGRCHPQQLREFRTSIMGQSAKQRLYTGWNNRKHAPHNCGVWFDGNMDAIRANTTLPLSDEGGQVVQRTCNSCHAACLDCHYFPSAADPADPRSGMHRFVRQTPSSGCYGGGRGQLCHAGPEDRRRGAGYFGGQFSHPEGLDADIHLAAGVGCPDCHRGGKTGTKMGHGLFQRQVSCKGCHAAAVASHARSSHRRLSCEACHIFNVGGYQATFWAPGELAGIPTPFFKYKEYYGIMAEPILVRDQKGRWIPVKPFPMAVLGQKEGPQLRPGLHWRWPASLPDLQRTDDAFGYVGTFDDLPRFNNAILWLQMDKLSHKLGKSRPCGSCHGLPGGEQRQLVRWDFSDRGAAPFSGHHTVVAGRRGLAIEGMVADEEVVPAEGGDPVAFAPFLTLGDRWRLPGNFALPTLSKKGSAQLRRHGGDTGASRKAGIIHH
jgi:hypothetical protein